MIVFVIWLSANWERASPKSATFVTLLRVRIRLAGLMSRCTKPSSWAASRPAAASRIARVASRQGMG